MISISESNRDFLRFLWIDDISKEPPETVAMQFACDVFDQPFPP